MSTVVSIQNVSKKYRLGVINRDMLYKDLQSRWAIWRGKPDPNAIGTHHAVRLEQDGEFWALRNVNLEIEQGEIIGIIGSNGSGKSTLLKILSQITAPTEGQIKINGSVASLLEVGTGFHQELTGRENVFLNGAILGMSKADVARKFDEIVSFSEANDFIDTPVKRYSSGMRVKLAFSVAAHLDANILVVDEVLAVGDSAFQQKCIKKISSISEDGRTIMFVSHNLGILANLCTSGVVLEAGTVAKRKCEIASAVGFYADQIAAAAGQDFSRRGVRSEDASLIIEKVSFHNADVLAGEFIASGDDLAVSIEYECNAPTGLECVDFRLQLNEARRGFAARFSSGVCGRLYSLQKGKGRIMCRIQKVPLCEGTYIVDAVARSGGIVVDRFPGAAKVMIAKGDFFSTGAAVGSDAGFLVEQNWE
ncbi:MAG: polysaccharide ABC transporter ATP-binding protein [Armatimonadota bacterium]